MSGRQILNIEQLDAEIEHLCFFAGHTQHPATSHVNNWLKTTFRKWLINHGTAVRPNYMKCQFERSTRHCDRIGMHASTYLFSQDLPRITVEYELNVPLRSETGVTALQPALQPTDTSFDYERQTFSFTVIWQPWMSDVVNSANGFIWCKEIDNISDKYSHLADYLHFWVTDRIEKNLKPKICMSVEQALQATREWDRNRDKVASKKRKILLETKDKEGDVQVVIDSRIPRDWELVRLISKAAYEREGMLMNHCVASYYGSTSIILSLRHKGESKATLELQHLESLLVANMFSIEKALIALRRGQHANLTCLTVGEPLFQNSPVFKNAVLVQARARFNAPLDAAAAAIVSSLQVHMIDALMSLKRQGHP